MRIGMGQQRVLEEKDSMEENNSNSAAQDNTSRIENGRLVEIPASWLNRFLPSTEPMKGIDWQNVFGRVFFFDEYGVFKPLYSICLEDMERVVSGELFQDKELSDVAHNLPDILQKFTSLPLARIHHYANTGEYLSALFTEKKLIDVLIHVEDKTFAAHRLALACHSVYFARAFILNERQYHKLTQVRLKNVEPQDFFIVLRFIYTGQLYLNSHNVDAVMKVANQLQMSGVLFKCLAFLSQEKTAEVVVQTAPQEARDQANRLLQTHLRSAMHSNIFLKMEIEAVEMVLGDDHILIESEMDVFNAAVSWLAHDVGSRRKYLERLMRNVRFTCMTPWEVIEATQVNNLVRNSPYCRNRVLEAIWLMTVKGYRAADRLRCHCPKPRQCLLGKGPQASRSMANVRVDRFKSKSPSPTYDRPFLPEYDDIFNLQQSQNNYENRAGVQGPGGSETAGEGEEQGDREGPDGVTGLSTNANKTICDNSSNSLTINDELNLEYNRLLGPRVRQLKSAFLICNDQAYRQLTRESQKQNVTAKISPEFNSVLREGHSETIQQLPPHPRHAQSPTSIIVDHPLGQQNYRTPGDVVYRPLGQQPFYRSQSKAICHSDGQFCMLPGKIMYKSVEEQSYRPQNETVCQPIEKPISLPTEEITNKPARQPRFRQPDELIYQPVVQQKVQTPKEAFYQPGKETPQSAGQQNYLEFGEIIDQSVVQLCDRPQKESTYQPPGHQNSRQTSCTRDPVIQQAVQSPLEAKYQPVRQIAYLPSGQANCWLPGEIFSHSTGLQIYHSLENTISCGTDAKRDQSSKDKGLRPSEVRGNGLPVKKKPHDNRKYSTTVNRSLLSDGYLASGTKPFRLPGVVQSNGFFENEGGRLSATFTKIPVSQAGLSPNSVKTSPSPTKQKKRKGETGHLKRLSDKDSTAQNCYVVPVKYRTLDEKSTALAIYKVSENTLQYISPRISPIASSDTKRYSSPNRSPVANSNFSQRSKQYISPNRSPIARSNVNENTVQYVSPKISPIASSDTKRYSSPNTSPVSNSNFSQRSKQYISPNRSPIARSNVGERPKQCILPSMSPVARSKVSERPKQCVSPDRSPITSSTVVKNVRQHTSPITQSSLQSGRTLSKARALPAATFPYRSAAFSSGEVDDEEEADQFSSVSSYSSVIPASENPYRKSSHRRTRLSPSILEIDSIRLASALQAIVKQLDKSSSGLKTPQTDSSQNHGLNNAPRPQTQEKQTRMSLSWNKEEQVKMSPPQIKEAQIKLSSPRIKEGQVKMSPLQKKEEQVKMSLLQKKEEQVKISPLPKKEQVKMSTSEARKDQPEVTCPSPILPQTPLQTDSSQKLDRNFSSSPTGTKAQSGKLPPSPTGTKAQSGKLPPSPSSASSPSTAAPTPTPTPTPSNTSYPTSSDEEVPFFKVFTSHFDADDMEGQVTGIEVGFERKIKEPSGSRDGQDYRARKGAEVDGMARSETPVPVRSADIWAVAGYLHTDSGGKGACDVQRLRSREKQWEKLTEMPAVRLNFAAALLNGRLYVTGGYNPKDTEHQATKDTYQFDLASKQMLSTAEVYDPGTDRWASIPSMSSCRVSACAAAFRGRVIVLGGYSELDDSEDSCVVLQSAEWFEPLTNRWESCCPLRIPRAQACLVQVDNCLYLCAGATRNVCTGVLCSIRDVDMYDPDTDQWTHLTDLQTARHNAGATVIGSQMYVVGGVSTDTKEELQTMECYDTATGQWVTSLPDLPAGAKSLVCMSVLKIQRQ